MPIDEEALKQAVDKAFAPEQKEAVEHFMRRASEVTDVIVKALNEFGEAEHAADRRLSDTQLFAGIAQSFVVLMREQPHFKESAMSSVLTHLATVPFQRALGEADKVIGAIGGNRRHVMVALAVVLDAYIMDNDRTMNPGEQENCECPACQFERAMQKHADKQEDSNGEAEAGDV